MNTVDRDKLGMFICGVTFGACLVLGFVLTDLMSAGGTTQCDRNRSFANEVEKGTYYIDGYGYPEANAELASLILADGDRLLRCKLIVGDGQ